MTRINIKERNCIVKITNYILYGYIRLMTSGKSFTSAGTASRVHAIDLLLYSKKSGNILGLDSYILNSLNYLYVIWTYISHCMTSLVKLEITV